MGGASNRRLDAKDVRKSLFPIWLPPRHVCRDHVAPRPRYQDVSMCIAGRSVGFESASVLSRSRGPRTNSDLTSDDFHVAFTMNFILHGGDARIDDGPRPDPTFSSWASLSIKAAHGCYFYFLLFIFQSSSLRTPTANVPPNKKNGEVLMDDVLGGI